MKVRPAESGSPGFPDHLQPSLSGPLPDRSRLSGMSHLIAERIVGAVVIGHGPKIERIQQAPILDEPRAAVAHHVVRAAALLVFEAGGVTAPLNFRHVIAPAAA